MPPLDRSAEERLRSYGDASRTLAAIEGRRILDHLLELEAIPSPTGYTDSIVRHVCGWLDGRGIDYELTRRGAIRANLRGEVESPDRAVVGHLDTLGAQVTQLKANGRLAIRPVGTWAARFAEGARVTVFTEAGPRRGTILPLKASGHVFDQEIETQPAHWDNLEIRVDDRVSSSDDLVSRAFHVGDMVAVDPQPEVTDTGFINARHLDDKAGVAAMMEVLSAVTETDAKLPVDCHFLFTISEETGSGASAVLHGDVAELLAVDNATVAPGQSSAEYGVTIAMGDMTGPFDYHLTRGLIDLARRYGIDHRRDVFKHYRCDAASAIEAGNDIRTALVAFGLDASHGWERVHIDSLAALARLVAVYVMSPPVVQRDELPIGPLDGFPDTQE
ncbi:peptidase M42 [Thalassobaculum fulvum]|uniref:Peptidase M42 n=1 Tax=Thalassobaculum fulvum TaxID=1633335 RepID=A0A918XUU2_9PROT|nr:osmoprotectant NAGGN system M42 family peptidase [Thalassobaculum fulvum]GHD58024.1 peptidase M42 [Thalassobaculum fulvum]